MRMLAARLAAGSNTIQDRGSQPFGRAVNGGRQSRGPGAHHQQIVNRILQRLMDADLIRQFLIRRVAQQQHVRAGHNRRIGLRHAELLEHLIHLRVGLQIHPGEEHAVLGEKIAHAKRVRRITRPDHSQADEVRAIRAAVAGAR